MYAVVSLLIFNLQETSDPIGKASIGTGDYDIYRSFELPIYFSKGGLLIQSMIRVHYRWFVLAGVCGIIFANSVSGLNVLTVFFLPMSEEFSWNRTQMSGAASIGALLGACWGYVWGTFGICLWHSWDMFGTCLGHY